jgi:hypothetical protein
MGWPPLPCNGKAAILPRWSELCRIPWDYADLIDATMEFSDCNCGIAADCKHIFIDLDIVDYQLADVVAGIADRKLGSTPLIRVGQEPKTVRIYRNGPHGRIRSSKLHPIEVMCGSGQIVAFGVHPGTRQPYRWVSDHSPLSLSADSSIIPLIYDGQLRQFLVEACKAIARTHYVGDHRAHARQSVGDRTLFLDLRHRLRIDAMRFGFERAAIRLLHEVREGNRHATAFEVVASAAGRGWTEAQITHLFEAHFAGWGGVSDDAFCRILDLCFRGNR